MQTENIRRLEAAGKSHEIPSYNIEPIILNSREYGKLELQKTGVAVRDPTTGRITGWVVSFNVVKSHEPDKYRRFHTKHKNQIQALLDRKERTSRKSSEIDIKQGPIAEPKWIDSPSIDEWIKAGCKSSRLHIADGYSQKQECFDFCASVMKRDTRRYGLESVEFLDEWFFDYQNAEYVLMRTPDNDLVGVFRIHFNRKVDYPGIEDWVIQAAEDGQTFADVGAYLHPSFGDAPRAMCLAQMLGRAARIGERNDHVHLYAQVPSYLATKFYAFLFQWAGKNFKCPGWGERSWTPIVSKCLVYADDGEDDGETVKWPIPERVDHDFVNFARNEYKSEKKTELIV